MKRPLLYIMATFLLLQSCIATTGVNTSQLYTDKHGTVVSLDRKFVHTTDIYGRDQRYTMKQWLERHPVDKYKMSAYVKREIK